MINHKKRPVASGRRGEHISRSYAMNSRYQFIAADNICHAFSQVFGKAEHHFIADGQIHRLDDPTGRPGNNACWYLCDHLSGVFGSWRQDVTYFTNQIKPDLLANDPAWIAKQKKIILERQLQHQQTLQVCQKAAAERARYIWNNAVSVSEHAYLQRKQVPAFNLRLHKLALIVPLFDGATLCNLQFIQSDGSKRFLKHGKVQGCYTMLGELHADQPLLVCEGWATGATLHMQYHAPVACAMFAGNLLHVAQALRARYPNQQLIICADDDRQSQHNAGVQNAMLAAQKIKADWVKPVWPAHAPANLTDFNDLYVWLLQQGGAHDAA